MKVVSLVWPLGLLAAGCGSEPVNLLSDEERAAIDREAIAERAKIGDDVARRLQVTGADATTVFLVGDHSAPERLYGEVVQDGRSVNGYIDFRGGKGRMRVPPAYDPSLPWSFRRGDVDIPLPKIARVRRSSGPLRNQRDGWTVAVAPESTESMSRESTHASIAIWGPPTGPGTLTTYRVDRPRGTYDLPITSDSASEKRPPFLEAALERGETGMTAAFPLGWWEAGAPMTIDLRTMTSPATAISFRMSHPRGERGPVLQLAEQELGTAHGRKWRVVQGNYAGRGIEAVNEFQHQQALAFLQCDPPLKPTERLAVVGKGSMSGRRWFFGDWGSTDLPIVAGLITDREYQATVYIQSQVPEVVRSFVLPAPSRAGVATGTRAFPDGWPVRPWDRSAHRYVIPEFGAVSAEGRPLGLRPRERVTNGKEQDVSLPLSDPAWLENSVPIMVDAGVRGMIAASDNPQKGHRLVLTFPRSTNRVLLRAPRSRFDDPTDLGPPLEVDGPLFRDLPAGFLREGDLVEIAGERNDSGIRIPFRLLLPAPFVRPYRSAATSFP